jgi:type 1 glutamine amidotransferase
MKYRVSSFALAAVVLHLPLTLLAAADANPTWQRNADSVALLHNGMPVWQFNYGSNGVTKPYFHPLALPGGSPLTCAKPPDHHWHYGLWFSWQSINKVNYWEENKQNQSAGLTSWRVENLETRPDFSASIVLALDYRKPGAAQPVLTERRVITITPPAADGSYAMDWKLEFQAGAEPVKFDRTPVPPEPNGKPWGGYAGLSVRLAKELSDAQVSATAAPGTAVGNFWRFNASGADFNGRLDNTEVGIAMLDNPTNPRFPTPWYAITDPKQPFWFLNAAWLQQQPFELAAMKNIRLCYRVLVHPKRWDANRLETEARRFAGDTLTIERTTARRILVYTKNGKGYVHDNMNASVAALRKLGEENQFAVDVTDDPAAFTGANLKRYQALVFSNTNNRIFDTEAQRTAFQDYLLAGGGFVGIHSVCGSEREWPWFWSMLGGKFLRHSKIQPITIKVRDPAHPSTAHLGNTWQWNDEFYFLDHLNPAVHVLLAGDLTTLIDPEKDTYPGTMPDNVFPLAWCHEFEGGRVWYSGLGHNPDHYADPKYTKHLLGGILWAMKAPPATPPDK